MDLKDLKEKWLFVAYSAKKDDSEYEEDEGQSKQQSYRDVIQEGKGKRHFAGAKGIGRFSCDRLGNRLTLKTRKDQPAAKWECLDVNWRDFAKDPKEDFVNIQVSHATLDDKSAPRATHGTELTIRELSDDWDRDKKLGLKRSLEKLLNPHEEADDFSITIVSQEDLAKDKTEDEPKRVNGPVHNFVFEKLALKTTFIDIDLESGHVTITLNDRGKLVYKIREKHKFEFIEKASAKIFYLNQKAKVNFAKYMGITSVDFGSVFVFRNGFRVYPYGNEGSDFFSLDRRKQQGYSKYLGSREIIGRLDVTDTKSLFVEKSSRDGGLIDSPAVEELIFFFKRKCLFRLEKYVRIQWTLKEPENGEETTRNIESSTGAQQEIAKMIFNLASSRSIEILEVGKDFLSLVKTKIDEVKPKHFKNLAVIAKATGDTEFLKHIKKGEDEYYKAIRAKELAEDRQRKAELAREKAEERAAAAGKARREAEERERKAEQARGKADQDRREAELREREAKVKAFELARQKEVAEKKKRDAEAQAAYFSAANKEKAERILFYKAERGLDIDGAKNFTHAIIIAASNINITLENVKEELREIDEPACGELKDLLSDITMENQKILALSRYVTKANFKADADKISEDIVLFLKQYTNIISSAFTSRPRVAFTAAEDCSFIAKFRPLDISILLDNVINNAKKAGAKNFLVQATMIGEDQLQVSFSDDGKGLDDKLDDAEIIFEKGFTSTDGSGLGLHHVWETVQEIGGTITVTRSKKDGFELIMRLGNGN